MNDDPCEVPLAEKLRSVHREWYVVISQESSPWESRSIPYGKFCHLAADEVDRLREELRVEKALGKHYRLQFKRIIRKTSYNSSASNIAHSALGMKAADFSEPEKKP